ncbi:hypothetical protein KP509_08G027300 [Ceratopteris richardii]|uniref:Uncharacterized protein n=1 Tax=Ceratopteris richardii TaxID=49495 RepID=A0A8T2U6S7_CERRI|nr:hypothetical protein KP509_08G027300 [Ceratopteris richardii]
MSSKGDPVAELVSIKCISNQELRLMHYVMMKELSGLSCVELW